MAVHLPQLWGVLYADPNTNGARKKCSNCVHANVDVTQCAVVAAPIAPEMVCGYHVETGASVPAVLAGLETVPGGTSCNRCRFFAALWDATGACLAVESAAGGPAIVAALGCCARWEPVDSL